MNKRVTRINLKSVVASRSDVNPHLSEPGDAVLVERGRPRLLVLRCPCGCGDDIPINLDNQAGKAWRFFRKEAGVTLYPSYWRDDGCESHFILWNDRVSWCGLRSNDDVDLWRASEEVESQVLSELSPVEFVPYWEISDLVGILPWEALQACRQLVRKHKAMEGFGDDRGQFKRA